MKKISDYEYVYNNWYCRSCKKINEEPVSFNTYLKMVPVELMMELKGFLDEGRQP